MNWLEKDRFGLFIHWGLYSLPARHEWIQNLEKIQPSEYKKYFDKFDPDLFDPKLWAKLSAEAGMKFFCITTKHHEGFCLWDSEYTDYKITNTPFKRDAVKELVEAFADEGLKTGLYYSLIDWHHEHFTIDSLHPLINNPDWQKLNQTRDQSKYIDYMHRQVKELLEKYKPVDLMFLDFSYPDKIGWPPPDDSPWIGKGAKDWGSPELLKIIRKYAPQALINDRMNLPERDCWDIKTPEQFTPDKWLTHNGEKVPWVTCQTFSGSWGYHREEKNWRSVELLLKNLIATVSRGGTLLLNVGPTGRGTFDQRAIDRLKGIGQWMKFHSRSIYNCTQAPEELSPPDSCYYTYNRESKRLYLHILSWPDLHLQLPNLNGKVEYAQFLHDGSEVKLGLNKWYQDQYAKIKQSNSNLFLNLPLEKPDVAIPVIELYLKG